MTMNKLISVIIVLFIITIGAYHIIPREDVEEFNPEDYQPKKRIIFIGVDGGTWKVIMPLIRAGRLPNLQYLVENGAHGNLISFKPMRSPVVWTTIFTGKKRKKHGITGWSESVIGEKRQVESLWTIASVLNLSTAVVNVPGTYPPEAVNGVMISGFPLEDVLPEGSIGKFHKIDLKLQGKESTNFDIKTELKHHLAFTAYDAHPKDGTPDSLTMHGREGDERPNFELVVGQWSRWLEFTGPRGESGLQKIKFVASDNESLMIYITPFFRKPVRGGYAITYPNEFAGTLDKQLGAYIPESVGWDRFGEESGQLRTLKENILETSEYHMNATRLLLNEREWDVFITVFTATDRVMHRYWKYTNPESFKDVDEELIEEFGDVIGEAFVKTDEYIGEILTHADENTLVVVASDHGFKALPKLGIGDHAQEGIIIFYGKNVAQGKLGYASISDVTPTILYFMDLPTGKDMDGRVIKSAIKEAHLKTHPVKYIKSYDIWYKKSDRTEKRTPPQKRQRYNLSARLESLGYMI